MTQIQTKQSILKFIKEAEAQFSGTGKSLLDIEDYVAEYITANGVIVPLFKVGDDVWAIDYEDGEAVDVSCVRFLASAENFIIATAFINDYDIDETIEYHIDETQENFDTDLKMYKIDDCFPTCEEAEKALAERSKE